MAAQVLFISTRPAALGELLALTAASAADPLGAAVTEALPLPLWLDEAADDESLAGPLDVEDVELEDDDEFPLALALILELERELELALALAVGLAARLAVPPPMVEKGVHWEVGPAGCGAGVVGSS